MAITPIKKKPVTTPPISSTPAKPLPVQPYSFEHARTSIPKTGTFSLLYGKPGTGKTTLAAQFPKPLFIITSGETGIDKAKELGVADKTIPVVELESPFDSSSIPKSGGHPGYIKAIETLHAFAKKKHDRRTAVLDTLSGFELLALQHCASIEFDGDTESRKQDCWNHYATGPRRMAEGYWAGEFLPACIACVNAGYNVVLVGHTNIRNVPNPAGVNYEEYRPELHDRLISTTTKVVHNILFMGMSTEMAEASSKGGKQIVGAKNRFIGLDAEATWYMAKNWNNLTDPVFCGTSAKDTFSKLSEVLKFS